jgi:hypothetical protein
MDQFKRDGACYYSSDERVEIVDLASVEPPLRADGVKPFKKYKLVPVLFALGSPECNLPPVTVTRLPGTSGFLYRVTNGFHRYYCSAAVGYPGLPVIVQDDE